MSQICIESAADDSTGKKEGSDGAERRVFRGRSEEVEESVEVNVARDVTNFTSVNGDLVSQHAWSRNLDGVGPVEVAVAECIGEVKDGLLGDSGGVLSHVEVSRLHCSLGHRVRNQVEVELPINYLSLLHEGRVHIGALWWVSDVALGLLEESLSDSLVHNHECDLWLRLISSVLLYTHGLELSQFLFNDHVPH